ncbi:hypothetical protein SmJEL517_g02179 [Synchytrium microbalum]|uniref:DUF1348 domain-containing protein n=1 Tax=Synchytrium microbalum TaxID=1806994 RepID=A0A507C7L5_9FUNG|nr:uncharacterized protein SmJEL517_g02179 [Synchytrium microbalum]TPX35491.1 hypothetical protein SmJEL517_g02179 [Synchytrium microbalum]
MTKRLATASTAKLIPPFTLQTAIAKVQRGEDLWNTRNPELVAKAYTPDCIWRNRHQFIKGTSDIKTFLALKWKREQDYILKKELFIFSDDRIAVQFWYEYHDGRYNWFRAYGLEHWYFNDDGLMKERRASINDLGIKDCDRWFVNGSKTRGEDPAG